MHHKRRRSSSISSASSWSSGSSSAHSSSPSRGSSSSASSSSSSGSDSRGSSTDENEKRRHKEGRKHHHHRRARRRESSKERQRGRRREHRKHRRRRHHHHHGEEDPPSSGMSTTLLWGLVALLVVLGAVVVTFIVIGKTSSTSPSSTSAGLSDTISGPRTTSGAGTNPTGGAAPTAAASGAASSLAALSSMTAASVPTLPMPTAAISDPNATLAYIKSDWSWVGGGSNSLTFIEDPFGGSEIVFAVEYPKGSYSGSKGVGGGVGSMHLDVFGDAAPNRSIVSYDLAFSKDFNFMAGGKLPGLYGGNRADHCTGGRMTTACFSLRLMWRTNGAGEVYGYIPTAPSQCGQGKWLCHAGNAISMERGSFTFRPGQWQTVTEVAVLNSDPKEDGTVANGELSVYFNNVLAFSSSEVVFRTNGSVTFSSFLISSFFGGSTPNYESQGGFSYYKNFQFFAGSDPSSASVETVAAKVNGSASDDS